MNKGMCKVAVWLAAGMLLAVWGVTDVRAEFAWGDSVWAKAGRVDARSDFGGRLVHGVERMGDAEGGAAQVWNTTKLAEGWQEVAKGGVTAEVAVVNASGVAVEYGRLGVDAVWGSGKVHLVRDWVAVPSGVTLEIGAGAVVKFTRGTGIWVERGGTLKLSGTQEMPVKLTVAEDDTVGGNTDMRAASAVAGYGVVAEGAVEDSGWTEAGYVDLSQSGLMALAGIAVGPGKVDSGRAVASAGTRVDGRASRQGPRLTEGREWVAWNTDWDGAESVRVELVGPDGGTEVLGGTAVPGKGTQDWTGEEPGTYRVGYRAEDGAGNVLRAQTVTLVKLGDDVALHAGYTGSNEVWAAGSVHVVDGTVTVESGAALTIERGAVVKFTSGSVLAVSGGGTCVAEGVIFTHIADDTAGGDTMGDGAASWPVANSYSVTGNLTTDAVTEMRWMMVTTSGTVSTDTVWMGSRIVHVTGNLTVASGATLTIQPGAIVKFDEGVSLTVNSGGTLNAIGTRAQPIVFTSVKDDEHGGDTNGDGGATVAQPGDWTTIKIAGGTAHFSQASILYSSRNETTGAINMTGGKVVFDSGEIAHGLYDAVGVESGNFHMTNSVIRDCLLAFRHWAKDPIVNCVIYDCGRLTQGGGQHFRNCIFANITEAWEAFGFPQNGTTYDNCCFWNEGGSVLTGEGTQDAMTVCGKNGNIWGDPLFLDADDGDFRVAEGSPCVDAGDTAAAPETDFFGQPRASAFGEALADIGIYEVQPRGVAGDVDLVPVSVSADAEAVPGGELRVSWVVGNRGGKVANGARRDAVSLVSAGGREVALGEKVFSQSVAAGGTAKCEAVFRVPPMAEGTWWPKVVVNSQQDIFEGSLISNNARTGDSSVEVSVPATAAASGALGTVAAGVPTVLKLHFEADDGNRMVVLNVPQGVSVAWGFGFVPAAGGAGGTSGTGGTAGASGTAESSGAPVQFVAPDGVEDVYVVLESGEAGAYELSTESGKLAVTSVEPGEVPSSGEATLAVSGAGFMPGAAVKLKGNGATIAAESVRVVDSRTISATVDCGKLAAGAAYDLVVESADATAAAGNAVHVAAAPGEGKFWARLDVPGSVREGRKVSCSVEYGNSGNADLAAQILQINVEGSGTLQYVGNSRSFQSIHFVAATSPQGGIPAGDSGTIPFVLVAGRNSRIQLFAGEADNAQAISLAASIVGARGSDMHDYRLVANELSPDTAVDMATWQEYGAAFPVQGEDVSLRVDLGEFGEESVSLYAKNIETTETYMPFSHVNGIAEFVGLPAGGYRVFAESESHCGATVAAVGPSVETITVPVERKVQIAGTMANAQADDIVVFISEGDSHCAMVDGDGTYSLSLPGGIYDARVMTSGMATYDSPEDIEVNADMTLDFPDGEDSRLGRSVPHAGTKAVPTRTDYNDSIFENKYTQARKRIDEGVRLFSLASAAYRPPTGEYDCPHNQEIYWDNYRRAEMFRIRLFTFMSNARMADSYKALALLGKSVHDTARAYLDYWLASKTKFAERRFHKWAGGLFNAKQKIGTYVSMKGVDILEAKIGEFDTEVQSLQYLIDHRELSLSYVEQVLDKIASIKNGISGIQDDLDALKAAGTILTSDVSYLETSLFGDIWGYLNAASTIAELVSDWMKTGEAGGEWLAGRVHIDDWMREFEAVMRDFAAWLPPRAYLQHCCEMKDEEDIANGKPEETKQPQVPQSWDPNEMEGPLGAGAARLVAPGEWMTYTVYFENKAEATAAAQEVYVTEQLGGALDWSTFEMVDVGFNNQLDLGLGGKRRGSSVAAMTGRAYKVRTELDFDAKKGTAKWYMRIVDESTETRWPRDVYAGFLPPNDETGRGEGHITYRVKLRDDAAAGTVVRASASIVFDYNAAIETDPAWWNTVAEMGEATVDLGNGVETNVTVMVGAPWGGQLPDPGKWPGMRFAGWFTGADGTGEEVTDESLVEAGAKLYAFWDATAAAELWLDVSWGSVEIGTNGVVRGYGLDGEAVEGTANRYVLTGTSAVYGVRFAGGSFTNTWTNLSVKLGAKDAVAVALEGASVDVELEGDNEVSSGEDCAGVRVDEGSALVLDGVGRLAAQGGAYGAGIGGGLEQKSGRIEIRGGTVEAKGGDFGAGIGGGLVGPGAEVVITGGSVKAKGQKGADIGNGYGEVASGAPKDGLGASVYEVEVPFAVDALPVVVAVDLGGGRTYQYEGMGHQDDTSLWFWLPDGTYDFKADGDDYGAHVEGAKVAAVFTDPGAEHFAAPAAETVKATGEGWCVGLNPAYRTTPFILWTATGLDGSDWAWEEVDSSTYSVDAETGAVEWEGKTEGLRVFKFQFLPKE